MRTRAMCRVGRRRVHSVLVLMLGGRMILLQVRVRARVQRVLLPSHRHLIARDRIVRCSSIVGVYGDHLKEKYRNGVNGGGVYLLTSNKKGVICLQGLLHS